MRDSYGEPPRKTFGDKLIIAFTGLIWGGFCTFVCICAAEVVSSLLGFSLVASLGDVVVSIIVALGGFVFVIHAVHKGEFNSN